MQNEYLIVDNGQSLILWNPDKYEWRKVIEFKLGKIRSTLYDPSFPNILYIEYDKGVYYVDIKTCEISDRLKELNPKIYELFV